MVLWHEGDDTVSDLNGAIKIVDRPLLLVPSNSQYGERVGEADIITRATAWSQHNGWLGQKYCWVARLFKPGMKRHRQVVETVGPAGIVFRRNTEGVISEWSVLQQAGDDAQKKKDTLALLDALLVMRFSERKSLDDLDEVIPSCQHALRLISRSDADLFITHLTLLAELLAFRSQWRGDSADLDAAILLEREASALWTMSVLRIATHYETRSRVG
jgi:hypothetical protein